MIKQTFYKILLYTYLTSIFQNIHALRLKYEAPFSYGIIGSIDIFIHPQPNDTFIKQNPNCTKTNRLWPGGSIFFDYRFFENLFSFGISTTYTNRTFAHDSDLDHIKTITNRFQYLFELLLWLLNSDCMPYKAFLYTVNSGYNEFLLITKHIIFTDCIDFFMK